VTSVRRDARANSCYCFHVNRSYRFRLYPTATQERALNHALSICAELYNAALQERRDAWARAGVSISLYDQTHDLSEIRTDRKDVAEVGVTVLRGALRRVNRAFIDFFRRCRVGGAPGYPRFRNLRRYDTLEVDDLGKTKLVVAGGRRVHVQMIGKIRFKQLSRGRRDRGGSAGSQRPMIREGVPKTLGVGPESAEVVH